MTMNDIIKKWAFYLRESAISEETVLEETIKEILPVIFEDLYQKIKHGDAEHQQWLKNEIDNFLNSLNSNQ